MELVTVMMIAAVDYGCTFDGLQVDLGKAKRAIKA